MSAITGIFNRDGCSISSDIIKKMNESLSHRGLDGKGFWVEGSVALGHQMLHTTHESLNEKLPFFDEKSGMVITADARIDNRAELSTILGLENKIYIPDSIFILKAYQKWGENCPERLLGDFAFAIWDKNKKSLFCARDHMGVKPFYYYLSDNLFIFATEPKALKEVPGIHYKLNELKIAFHLTLIDDGKSSFYKDIFRLPASHSLIIDCNESKMVKYWELDPESHIQMDTEEEYISEFRKIFNEAVKCRLRSAFPLGFELSGGLDSSSIVCTAKNILKNLEGSLEGDINTFSILFSEFQDSDERYYINEVLNTGEIKSHFTCGDDVNPLKNIRKILWHLEEPFLNKNMALKWDLYQKMHENKIRIYLSGHDGDNVISNGNYFFVELARTLQLKKLINEIYKTSKVLNNNKEFYNESDSVYIKSVYNNNLYQILSKKLILPLIFQFIPEVLKKNIRSFYNSRTQTRFKPDVFILNKDLLKRSNIDTYLKELVIGPRKQAISPKQFHFFKITSFSHQYSLEFLDRGSAAFCMEPRFPFYDKRLIEFCYALPTEMKYKDGWPRFILRKAMEDIIPEKVQWRVYKQDFDPASQYNLLFYGKTILNKMIYNDNHIIQDYVDIEKLKEIYERYKLQGNGTGIANSPSDSANVIDIWLVTTLYLWLIGENKNDIF